MIVELLDYRPQKAKDAILTNPERSRVVLTPSSETLWADICLLNQKAGNIWTDQEALEVEARILVRITTLSSGLYLRPIYHPIKVATAPPLCLDPDPHLTRMANHVLRVSVPKTPPSLKRKAAAMEQEEEENDKARRIKISQYMNPRNSRSTPQRYVLLSQCRCVEVDCFLVIVYWIFCRRSRKARSTQPLFNKNLLQLCPQAYHQIHSMVSIQQHS